MFKSDLDFFSKFLAFVVLASIAFQIVYLLLPKVLRIKVDNLDYDPKSTGNFTLTGLISACTLLFFLVFKIQRSSIGPSSVDEKLSESWVAKELRHR